MVDFAGCGVVHMVGGLSALIGAGVLGPRMGRFDPLTGEIQDEMFGHNSALVVLGTFILWFGWYGFNPGSTLGITPTGYAMHASRSVVTTTLSAAAGGITVCLLEKLLGSKTWDVGAVCNGILGGLVSITAGCSTVYPWAAFVIGLLGGGIYFGASKLVLHKLKIDDPLDAFAVHGACGFWGCLMVGFFAAPPYAYGDSVDPDPNCPADCLYVGVFYGCGCQLAVTLSALFAELAWVGGMSFFMFGLLMKLGILRVSKEVEEAGMDVSKHGGSAYEMEVDMAKEEAKPTSIS